MIYDYIFYTGYKVASKNKKNADYFFTAGLMAVLLPLMFNIQAVLFLLVKLNIFTLPEFSNDFEQLIAAIVFFGLVWLRYGYKDRYKKIIAKYDRKREESSSFYYRLPCFLVFFSFWILSGSLIFIINIFF